MKNNKTTIMILMVAAVFVLSVAYAAFSTSLKINGTATVASTWSIAFANQACSATTTKDSATPSTCTATVSGNVITTALNFASPGDVLTLTFDIVNNGSLTANASLVASLKLGATNPSATDCIYVTTEARVLNYTTSGANGIMSGKTPVAITKSDSTVGPVTILSKNATSTYNKASYEIKFIYDSSATGKAGSEIGCAFKGVATATQAL